MKIEYDPKTNKARTAYATYDLRGWNNRIDTGVSVIFCPRCGSGILLKPYLTAIGTGGTRFCPYCGHRVQPERMESVPTIGGEACREHEEETT